MENQSKTSPICKAGTIFLDGEFVNLYGGKIDFVDPRESKPTMLGKMLWKTGLGSLALILGLSGCDSKKVDNSFPQNATSLQRQGNGVYDLVFRDNNETVTQRLYAIKGPSRQVIVAHDGTFTNEFYTLPTTNGSLEAYTEIASRPIEKLISRKDYSNHPMEVEGDGK